jgi:radical SAM superfamily enzyme YgiQ (UPF0313 family)
MRKKLILINPVNPRRSGMNINPHGLFPPLGLGIVAALTPGDWDIEILDENFEKFSYKEADLIGISSFTSSITRAYEIAGIYRKRGIPTAIGGIHASMLPEEAMQYVDSVLIGEAESTWPRFIEDFEKGNPKVIYRENRTTQTRMAKARHDLFHPSYVFDSIQTARGCPMDCDFCSVTTFNGGRYRQREVEDVLEELESIPQKFLYFVDDNIIGHGARASEHTLELFKAIMDRGIKKDWFSQASINFAEDDRVLEYAAKSGCRMILLGLEAESDDALRDAGKKLNRKFLERYEKVFRRLHNHGIAVLGSFIYGMEHDTLDTLSHRTKYILKNDVDAVQISLMTPLPGTRLFQRLRDEGRLLYTNFPDDWERYDMTEVVFKPLLIEPQDLFNAWCNAGIAIYNHATLWYKYMRTLSTTRDLNTARWAYSANRNYHNVGISVYLQRKLRSL